MAMMGQHDGSDTPRSLADKAQAAARLSNEQFLREKFPDKNWHRHRRTDGRTDLCDGTPSDCASKARV